MKRNFNYITATRGCFNLLSPQDESISIHFHLRDREAVKYPNLSIDSDYADESDFDDLTPLAVIAELRDLWKQHYLYTTQTKHADALEAYLKQWEVQDEVDRTDYELAMLEQRLHDTIEAIRSKRAYRRELEAETAGD